MSKLKSEMHWLMDISDVYQEFNANLSSDLTSLFLGNP